MRKDLEGGLTKQEFDSDDNVFILDDGPARDIAELLNEKLETNKFYSKTFRDSPNVVNIMNNYIRGLKEGGLDIGKGDAEFGYQMPLELTEYQRRELRIFRRYAGGK